ncbi:MAG: ABC transporter substrate-binding protein [Hydrogenophaga sp.]|jgi:branched-chain amino acid transport system substrate-binding protein|uniref:ABC transporter substrate-binding protein n=1 Tax=Hydrogenophaga sp. TaxID=1904254 RepID=UPI0027191FB0|nr:ABC transporter substrate-binding protein [Hydrogenophaga sp.]MDO9480911.1 ABC transporter substrate-binding protein [Hydrogenophaga sp.]MDO9569417.1 ABC transporter substrate-binding protein [Hydrogenophaga sp.]MDP1894979.1 ABC transporter substrate-binding protein [Hydrogenophaga sp.]MDP2096864.1 ABC transporter substrate-binding protein [Hydrogenophaga sp.]MDP3373591.1 ABC transporter substrate-binding protein [Hydrogenophaga sp.]
MTKPPPFSHPQAQPAAQTAVARHTVRPPRRRWLGALCSGALVLFAAWDAQAANPLPLQGQTVRIAFIDPLSGPAADIGRNSLRSWQFMAEHKSGAANPAGVRFVVAGFDNKGSPQESLNALKAAIDQGFRYIVQGNGSGVAAALSSAIARHNLRSPERAVLYINYAAMDPELTNEKCNFWHFRIDSDTAMKMRAMTGFMAAQPELRRVYLLNQNYAHGQQFSRYFRETMAQQRSDVQIVGDSLHPPFQGHDFTADVRNIQASGAQALATGNWGADLRDLVKALHKQGVYLPIYAYYPALKGVPAVLADTAGRMPVYQVAHNHSNQPGPIHALAAAFRQQHGEDLTIYASYDGIEMLSHAMAHVGSTNPAQVAGRLSGMIFKGFNGPVQMRADDHQLLKGLYVSRWQKVDATYPRSAEETGYTFAPVQYMDATQISGPTRCQMQRP